MVSRPEGKGPIGTAVWPKALSLVTSVEWGMVVGLMLLGNLAWMAAEWPAVQRQWRQDWLGGPVPAMTLLFLPVAWAFHELGRWLMWARLRGPGARWRVRWLGLWPLLELDPAELRRLRRRAHRIAVPLWGLAHSCLLLCIAWPMSHWGEDAALHTVARAWLYAAGIQLLLVDLNPLSGGVALKLLEEWLHQVNLAARSQAWWSRRGLLLLGHLVGLKGGAWRDRLGQAHMPFWGIWYAPLAWAWGCLLALWLVQAWRHSHPHLALLIMCGGWVALVLQPWLRASMAVWRAPVFALCRGRLLCLAVAANLVLLTVLLAWPCPRHVVAPGVVWLPERAHLVAAADGVMVVPRVEDGQSVFSGQHVWSLMPGYLQAVDTDSDLMLDAPGDWGQVPVHSPSNGQLLMTLPGDLEGRMVRRGQLLAQILPQEQAVVRCVLPASRVQDLQQVRQLAVRPQEQPGLLVEARRDRQDLDRWAKPLAELPARALGSRMGGPVAVLPGDPRGVTPTEPMVWLDVVLDRSWPRAGGLAWVKLTLPPQPLAMQWWAEVVALWRAGR